MSEATSQQATPASSEAIVKATLAHAAAAVMRQATNAQRIEAVRRAADHIIADKAVIVAANLQDMERAKASGMSKPLQDRLLLTDARLDDIVRSMANVADQADPIGRVITGRTLDSGIRMEQVTVPLGVVAMIYEARPNVTADAFALCARSGNAVVLRGGSAAHDSCAAIAHACREGLIEAGLPGDAIQFIDATGEAGHAETEALMRANGLVDVLIPRGGRSLIQTCVQKATVPVIQTGTGNCHIYLHKSADAQMAVNITVNAKTSRPGTCNSAESLLVDADAAERLLPPVCAALIEHGVTLVGDAQARSIAGANGLAMGVATEADWGTEYLDLKMSVHCVSGLDEAIAHINRYGTGHSEAIVTNDYAAGEQFLAGVDAAAVYVNASTRFTDGGMYGLGCEIGISTQKMHVRGPMGASALTTTKYLLRGDGQVR